MSRLGTQTTVNVNPPARTTNRPRLRPAPKAKPKAPAKRQKPGPKKPQFKRARATRRAERRVDRFISDEESRLRLAAMQAASVATAHRHSLTPPTGGEARNAQTLVSTARTVFTLSGGVDEFAAFLNPTEVSPLRTNVGNSIRPPADDWYSGNPQALFVEHAAPYTWWGLVPPTLEGSGMSHFMDQQVNSNLINAANTSATGGLVTIWDKITTGALLQPGDGVLEVTVTCATDASATVFMIDGNTPGFRENSGTALKRRDLSHEVRSHPNYAIGGTPILSQRSEATDGPDAGGQNACGGRMYDYTQTLHENISARQLGSVLMGGTNVAARTFSIHCPSFGESWYDANNPTFPTAIPSLAGADIAITQARRYYGGGLGALQTAVISQAAAINTPEVQASLCWINSQDTRVASQDTFTETTSQSTLSNTLAELEKRGGTTGGGYLRTVTGGIFVKATGNVTVQVQARQAYHIQAAPNTVSYHAGRVPLDPQLMPRMSEAALAVGGEGRNFKEARSSKVAAAANRVAEAPALAPSTKKAAVAGISHAAKLIDNTAIAPTKGIEPPQGPSVTDVLVDLGAVGVNEGLGAAAGALFENEAVGNTVAMLSDKLGIGKAISGGVKDTVEDIFSEIGSWFS